MSSELEFGARPGNHLTSSAGNLLAGEEAGTTRAGHRLYWLPGLRKDAKGDRLTDFYASIIPTWSKEVLDETVVNNDGQHRGLVARVELVELLP